MNNLLLVHWWVGILVVACGILGIWTHLGRRVLLYALSLQIALGFGLMIIGARVSWLHPAAAIVAAGIISAANAAGRRRGETVARAIAAGGTILLLVAYEIGRRAASASG